MANEQQIPNSTTIVDRSGFDSIQQQQMKSRKKELSKN